MGDFDNDGTMDGDLDGMADGNIQTTWYVNPDDSVDSDVRTHRDRPDSPA